jgi:glutamine amidotransferase
MITIVDSGIANIGSVVAAFKHIGQKVRVTADPAEVLNSDALVLPGVGAFEDGMQSLRRNQLVEPIRQAARSGVPLLGICLGMQLLADVSEEFGEHEGLGLIPGRVSRLAPDPPLARVPHIGWCDVAVAPSAMLFCGITPDSAFYFVHSYHLVCSTPEHTVGRIAFGGRSLCAAVQANNVFGVQFHPEKSQDAGLSVLHNYACLVAKRLTVA